MFSRERMPEIKLANCIATRTCSRRETSPARLAGVRREPRRRSATPRAPPAIRRAWSTATVRRSSTPSRLRRRRIGAFRAQLFLVVVPLFHANAWSLPFSAAMCGAKMELPGPRLDPESLYNSRSGGMHQGGRHSEDLAQFPRLDRGEQGEARPLAPQAEAGARRRFGAPPRATIEKIPRSARRLPAARLGHDRDEPDHHHRVAIVRREEASPAELIDMQVKQGRQIYGVEAQARRPRRARPAARRRLGWRIEGAGRLG